MLINAAAARKAAAPFSFEAVEIDEPRDGEVQVRQMAVGVCHSDVAARDLSLPVNMPVVPGLEGVGVVVSWAG